MGGIDEADVGTPTGIGAAVRLVLVGVRTGAEAGSVIWIGASVVAATGLGVRTNVGTKMLVLVSVGANT